MPHPVEFLGHDTQGNAVFRNLLQPPLPAPANTNWTAEHVRSLLENPKRIHPEVLRMTPREARLSYGDTYETDLYRKYPTAQERYAELIDKQHYRQRAEDESQQQRSPNPDPQPDRQRRR